MKLEFGEKTLFLFASGATISATKTRTENIRKTVDDAWNKRIEDKLETRQLYEVLEEMLYKHDFSQEQRESIRNAFKRDKRMEAYWLIMRYEEGRRAFIALKDSGIGCPWTPVPPEYVYFARLRLEKKCSPYVVTTNWDELLEVAFHQAGLEVTTLFGGAQPDRTWKEEIPKPEEMERKVNNLRDNNRVIVVKLHGTVSNAFSVMGSLDDIEDLTLPKRVALERLLKYHSDLVTVGWSASDLDIINVIKTIDWKDRPTLWAVSKGSLNKQPNLHRYLCLNKCNHIYNHYNECCADDWLKAVCDEMEISLPTNETYEEYDEIYKPMTREKESGKNKILQHKSTPVLIVHAANQKEIPGSFLRARDFFFSPFLPKSEYEHMFHGRTNSIGDRLSPPVVH
ncbi:SIR2 family protein [Vibrio sp.]|uniref:SIR2 family protein n=1 Tax=Vibrio sp. TaxID=678 RepID=UPI003D0DFF73